MKMKKQQISSSCRCKRIFLSFFDDTLKNCFVYVDASAADARVAFVVVAVIHHWL